jgi:hypothetical protein
LSVRVHDRLCPGAVGNVAGGQVHHQQAAVGIHGDVPLAAHDFLGAIKAAGAPSGRRLDRLAVQDGRAGVCRTPGPFTIDHPLNLWVAISPR